MCLRETTTVNHQLVARAFISQNGVGPRALKRDQAAIGNRLLFILALASTGPLFGKMFFLKLYNSINNQNVIINVIIMIIIIILIVTNTQKIAHFDLFDQTSFKKYQECMKAF